MGAIHAIHQSAPSIHFEDWKHQIRSAQDIDQVVRLMRYYLETWRPEYLGGLPPNLADVASLGAAEIVARAVVAVRAELKYDGSSPSQHAYLREMSLTLAAAAMRLRMLGFRR